MTTLDVPQSIRVAVAMARRDPSAFIEYVLGLQQGDVHDELQDWWTENDDSYAEEHRGIGKTVQATARVAWDIGKNPAVRVKYVQQNDTEAAKSVRVIREIIGGDGDVTRRYRHVFPHVRPDPSCWGSESIRVLAPDMGIQRDPTVEGKGVFGRAGGRWDILVCDDICDLRNAVQHAALRDQVKEAYKNTWRPMADPNKGNPVIRKVGTCYHVDDITADWRKLHADRGTLLRRPVVNFRSPWPEVFTEDYLRELRADDDMGPIAFGRAYELNPISSDILVFETEWFERSFVEGVPTGHHVEMVATFDWGFTEAKQKNDPDYSVCLIGAIDHRNHIYPCDMVRMRAPYPEFKRAALSKCGTWNVTRGAAEGNGPQKGLVQQLNADAPFPVRCLERTTDKFVRSGRRQSFVERGRCHLLSQNGEPIRVLRPLFDEVTTFPASGHDDTVDALLDMIEMADKPVVRQGAVSTVVSDEGRFSRLGY